MEINKAIWLLDQLKLWTNLIPNSIRHEIAMQKYVFKPLIEQTIRREDIYVIEKYAVQMENDSDKTSPEFRMIVEQLQNYKWSNFINKKLKPREIFMIQYDSELYNLLKEVYDDEEHLKQVLMDDGWFQPKNAEKNGVIENFCCSYWKIPEIEFEIDDTLRKIFPDGFYDKLKITISAK